MDGIDLGDVLTLAGLTIGWIASVSTARGERIGFEARLSTRFDALEERVRQLAGADTRITVLESHRNEDGRRIEELRALVHDQARRIQRLEGNQLALASERGVGIRVPTNNESDPGR